MPHDNLDEEEVSELVERYVQDEEPKAMESLKNAVSYVAGRMNLAQAVCDELFGPNIADVKDIYAMHDYLAREERNQVMIQVAKMRAQNQVQNQLELEKRMDKPSDPELN